MKIVKVNVRTIARRAAVLVNLRRKKVVVRMEVAVMMRMMERQSIWYQMQVVTSAPVNFLCCINLVSIPILWISFCRSL
jgi:hypothetical protein